MSESKGTWAPIEHTPICGNCGAIAESHGKMCESCGLRLVEKGYNLRELTHEMRKAHIRLMWTLESPGEYDFLDGLSGAQFAEFFHNILEKYEEIESLLWKAYEESGTLLEAVERNRKTTKMIKLKSCAHCGGVGGGVRPALWVELPEKSEITNSKFCIKSKHNDMLKMANQIIQTHKSDDDSEPSMDVCLAYDVREYLKAGRWEWLNEWVDAYEKSNGDNKAIDFKKWIDKQPMCC